MTSRIAPQVRQNVVGYLALFVALSTGTAYATHEVIDSSDVVDNSLTSADLKDNGISHIDLQNGNVRSVDIRNDTLPGGGLTGDDVLESSLDSSVLQRRVGGSCNAGEAISAIDASGAATCETGLQGPKGDPGTSFVWKGSWDDRTFYSANDVVSYNGSSWIARVGNDAQEPPGSDETVGVWDLMASKGDQGPQGPEGDPAVLNVSEVGASSATNSNQTKTAFALCPAGKQVTGGGARTTGSLQVAIGDDSPGSTGAQDGWVVTAHEVVPTSDNWTVHAVVLCV